MSFLFLRKISLLAVAGAFLTSCVTYNDAALKIGALPVEDGESVVSYRAMQVRRFDTLENKRVLQATTATLQDLGFTIGATSMEVGVLTASKDRDAIETGQVAGQVGLTILFALLGTHYNPVFDESQKINASVLISPRQDKSSDVRIIFDRHFTNNHGQLWRAEVVKDPEIYQQFFDKLSASMFLEGHAS